ncbi:hypothetical protein BIV57_18015 [Mangrovactinospora gilvigrisea]|uniref:Uncharacterized protein n=1 Tax=Mangrovactinospora gilvigrisea TaxID=1428644 RepID=A0A1J7BBX5_9ACTN|nr:hypothetical protein BIV57_18015 [Mangrovactinospora gilvigrisea]
MHTYAGLAGVGLAELDEGDGDAEDGDAGDAGAVRAPVAAGLVTGVAETPACGWLPCPVSANAAPIPAPRRAATITTMT